ncbi:hypothetical protein [Nocardia sp. NBC_01388]|uniref:hypothetical protein n=1 Tax=Nocardia sp. NBC_01388 TaxID=2903596 RepID=UPI00324AF973
MIEQRCAIYERRFGLAAYHDPSSGHILAATDRHTAGVLAPRSLAAAAFPLRDSGSVPAFSVSGNRWMFLTDGVPDAQTVQQMLITAFRYPIVPILAPTPVALPTLGSALRSWLYGPRSPARSPITIVVAALQTAAHRFDS